MFINTFRYTPEDVDCRLCTAFTRKDGCTAPRCLYLAERIEAGVVGYEELLRESFPADSVFRWRLRLRLSRRSTATTSAGTRRSIMPFCTF